MGDRGERGARHLRLERLPGCLRGGSQVRAQGPSDHVISPIWPCLEGILPVRERNGLSSISASCLFFLAGIRVLLSSTSSTWLFCQSCYCFCWLLLFFPSWRVNVKIRILSGHCCDFCFVFVELIPDLLPFIPLVPN